MYEKICRRHRFSGNVKGFNGESLYGAMNMWADTLPNNSFTSCKLLIDVQKHRYHPYRFRFTNRIIYRVKSTFRKKYLFTRSLCGITKIPFGSPKQTEPIGNRKSLP